MSRRPPLELAGDRMRIEDNPDGSATITFDAKGTGRACGGCTLCCKLLPILELKKAAGTRCQHSRAGKGCMIYAHRPNACRTWACRWLADADTAGMPRPDRAHYVIDMEWDYIEVQQNPGDPLQKQTVMQVWVDPAFPNAHRDPPLRAFMRHVAEKYRAATVVRYGSRVGLVVIAPSMSASGEWIESSPTIKSRTEEEDQIMRLVHVETK
ncbi:MAG TPA: hypothetical protein VK741_21755 [Acetobacteraceae bacterium]|jgi:hypothetical protein|nr:hypothetical protein [Acetobacteraceae bacterium]